MISIFGFELRKTNKDEIQTIITPKSDDGSVVVSSGAGNYYQQHVVDMDVSIKSENDLIRRYREISHHPECDAAVEEIVNEAISVNEDGEVATLNLDDLKVSTNIKKKIQDEFADIKSCLKFDVKAYQYFRDWYIDGRKYFIITLDADNPKNGIQKLDAVDSRKIRKVKLVHKKKDPKTGVDLIVKTDEFFIYNEKGIDANTSQGVKLSVDSVIYCPSGLFDSNSGMMFSYLHKAVKPVNQLKMLEDATVIYRLSRAPERRVFYVDVGNLPKVKAEQYVNDIMNKFKNKVVYDSTTGEIRDDRKFMSMVEDYWMPRREGGKGTEISTLPAGQNLGQIEDVNYFQQKVYQSLNVPVSRLLPSQNFSLGRSNEITRDELKFHKFITRLRNQFSQILIDALRVQLIAKNIIKEEEWDEVENNIAINFTEDNNFVELKESELLANRLSIAQQLDTYVGKYFSKAWVRKNVFKLTEEEIIEMEKEIKQEATEEPDEPEGGMFGQEPPEQPVKKEKDIEPTIKEEK